MTANSADRIARTDYDAIVIGARCAGSATAMILARMGFRILVVDKTTFPSDTISTHQIQVTGVALLKKWGLLDQLIEAGTPLVRDLRFDAGFAVLEASYPEYNGVDGILVPRRTLLDSLLVEAARAAGAEVREAFTVEDLIVEDDRVVGIRGKSRGGATISERARIVIGADGKHSLVAKRMKPLAYAEKPVLSMGYYTYWEGVPMDRFELFSREQRFTGIGPTNDGLSLTYTAAPVTEFHAFRADIEGNILSIFDQCDDFGDRLRAGKRVERFHGTADLPNRAYQPFGDGWALVGDAGLVMDPITAQGIGHAFKDAELLSAAIDDAFNGRQSIGAAMAGYQSARDATTMPVYELTTEIASFATPPPEQQALFQALAGNKPETSRFFGVVSGAIPVEEFFSPDSMARIFGHQTETAA